ncbi:BTB domain-containing protein [Favolaschia claudopus]|uniref:BTB domain-containing protein n=1 Tax=Favolaschia claudopus TaxID=2862362 RepID=A0AAV9Z324_9AGAR
MSGGAFPDPLPSLNSASDDVPGPPFDSVDADVIFRTADRVEFRLHRTVLSLISPVFRAMFSLPQPQTSPAIPIVDVSEASHIFDKAMRFIYPGACTTIDSPSDLWDILNVLIHKYDVHYIVPAAREQLRKFLHDEPLAVFIVAYTFEWNDLSIEAAKQTLKLPLRSVTSLAPKELAHFPAAVYHNLLRYHYLCGAAAKNEADDLTRLPFPNEYVWFSCMDCDGASLGWYLADGRAHNVRKWFGEYLDKVPLLVMECPSMDITCHISIQDALKGASGCETCRAKAFGQFPEWVKTSLKPRIEAAVKKVELIL